MKAAGAEQRPREVRRGTVSGDVRICLHSVRGARHPRPETRGLRVAWVTAIALLAAVAPAARSAAQTSDHQIVFLVDQSGSMYRAHGPRDSWRPNDPDGYRIEMILQAYESLQDRLDQSRDTTRSFTLHVVEFAGRVRRQPPIVVRYGPSRPAGSEVAAVKSRLRALRQPAGIDGGETDPALGLQEVLDLIRGAGRTTHVLLITDGNPYVEAADGSNLGNTERYKGRLRQVARQIRSTGSDLVAIGLVGAEDRQQYWPEWGPFWRVETAGNVFRVDDPAEISPLVDRLVRGWLGLPRAERAGNPYYCPPYLRSITFTVFKGSGGAQVEVKDANGRLLRDKDPDVTIVGERTYWRISVSDPVPGLWELDQRATDIRVEPFYKQIHRLAPTSPVNAGYPERFRYEVLSEGGRPFVELPAYPITAWIEVSQGGAPPQQIPVEHREAGLFEATDDHVFDPGAGAEVHFAATAPLPDGSVAGVFELSETLEVSAKELLTLDAGSSMPLSMPLRFGGLGLAPRLTVRRFGGSGEAIPLAAVSARPATLVKMRVMRSDGHKLGEASRWTAFDATEDGRLAAAAEIEQPLLSWATVRRDPVEMFVQVRVDATALDPGYQIRELKRDPGTEAEDGAVPFDIAAALPALRDDPLSLPLVAREGLATWVLLLTGPVLGAAIGLALLLSLGGRLGYLVSDTLRRQTVTVVIQARGGAGTEVRKNLTGRRSVSFRKPAAVLITIGDDPDDPDWKPGWLRLKRVFAPWTKKLRVQLRYPAPGPGGKGRAAATVVEEGQMPAPLVGMGHAEAWLEVRRRGQSISDQQQYKI